MTDSGGEYFAHYILGCLDHLDISNYCLLITEISYFNPELHSLPFTLNITLNYLIFTKG